MKLKNTAIIAGCVLLTALAAGCASKSKRADVLEQIQQEQVMKVAVLADNSPYSMFQPGTQEAQGKEVDLIKKIAEKMGVSAQFVAVDQAGLETALQDGSAQLSIGQIVETDGLKNRVSTSLAYDSGRIYVVTAKGDFSSTLGAFSNGTIGGASLLSENANILLNGITGVTIVKYADIKTVEADIIQKKILGYFCYETQAEELMKSDDLQAQSVSGIQSENHVIITGKSDVKLLAQIDSILSQMIENNEISEIWNP